MPGEQPHIIYKLPKITLVTHANMLSFLLKLADLRMFGRRKERGETNTWLLLTWSELPFVTSLSDKRSKLRR